MPINPKIGAGRPSKKDKKAHKTSPREIVRAQRAAEILNMRLQGYSLRAIGDAQTPKMDATRVHQIITAELEKSVTEPIEAVRKMELARLDEMQAGVYERAIGGDPISIDRVLAIQNRRASLAGLNAATKIEASGPGGGPIEVKDATDAEIAAALVAFLAKAGAKPPEAK